ncbi:MAG: M48 family metallopeptidase [Methylophilaceae bacterium]
MSSLQHSIAIAGREIPYLLKVSARRRTIGMRVDRNGLTVHIPSRMPRRDVPNILLKHADWIEKKLGQLTERLDDVTPVMQWEQGAALQYLGRELKLELQTGGIRSIPIVNGETLLVCLPDPSNSAVLKRKVLSWLRAQALEDFGRRIAIGAAQLGASTPPLKLSSAHTRWGSCNSKGEIRLNWRLIQAPPHIIHYVVAHELAHLKEMNHSPQFWAWVGKLCPEYSAHRRALKVLSPSLHLL